MRETGARAGASTASSSPFCLDSTAEATSPLCSWCLWWRRDFRWARLCSRAAFFASTAAALLSPLPSGRGRSGGGAGEGAGREETGSGGRGTGTAWRRTEAGVCGSGFPLLLTMPSGTELASAAAEGRTEGRWKACAGTTGFSTGVGMGIAGSFIKSRYCEKYALNSRRLECDAATASSSMDSSITFAGVLCRSEGGRSGAEGLVMVGVRCERGAAGGLCTGGPGLRTEGLGMAAAGLATAGPGFVADGAG